jgi:quercetin dioxygenase-like cupin family protein
VVEDDKISLSREDFLAAVDALSTSGTEPVDTANAVHDDAETAALYGERIRLAREWKGFTLDEVALKTGLDKAYLERAEAGREMLPLGALVKLAKTLSLRLADVISRGQEPFTVVRSGEGRKLQRHGNPQDGFGYSYESLAPNKKGKAMEPFLVTLFPNESLNSSSHEGQEFIYVLEGAVAVTLEGKTKRLEKGDAIYYDSLDDHLVTACGDAPAKIVAVLST